ncbi:MAG: alpha-L-arabinofuranosidase, partial [Limisphaerales bacterium]
MKLKLSPLLPLAAAMALLATNPATRATTLTIDAGHPGAAINPAMWGIFFEDINFGADGGLYAEMVKNRSFEFPDPMTGWIKISPSLAKGELSVRDDDPLTPANPHYLRVHSEGSAPFGISNEGFRRMGVSQDETYSFSVEIRGVDGAPALDVQLVAADGSVLNSARLENFDPAWKSYKLVLHPKDSDWGARLNVLMQGKGTVDL